MVTDSAGNQLRVVEVATGLDPAGIAVDATDAWGRVFVADRGSNQLTVLYGRSPALTVACRYPIPGGPFDVAVDDETGTVLVTLSGAPAVELLDGRGDQPVPIGSVELPGHAQPRDAGPGWSAGVGDPARGRAWSRSWNPPRTTRRVRPGA